VALDPHYAEAHWQLAVVQASNWINYDEDQNPNRANAISSAQRAVELDPNDSSARWALGHVLHYERRFDEANTHYEASFRMNPNDADALAFWADFEAMVGKPQEGVDSALKALRLNPHPPGWYYWFLGFALVANGQFKEAVLALQREETYRTASRRVLAAALALLGRSQEAHEEAQFFLAANPQWHISKWVETHPFQHQKDLQFWIDAYRLAGLPE
jgi:tetratricopeptide (TPR) repeat protein